MDFVIISVSKHSRDNLDAAIEEYRKRVRGGYKLSVITMKPAKGNLSPDERKKRETERILARLPKNNPFIIACDEKGKVFSTSEFAETIASISGKGRGAVVFLIGGAYGLDASLLSRCDLAVSLSSLTLSHRIALLLLAEQIYRIYTVLTSHPYAK
ncbi:MAG: 23S rRNA (pseudouridine(1915)-N(3))-methyltransferase RlmH [Myxococcota bacterium]